eukprot:gene20878-13415_t
MPHSARPNSAMSCVCLTAVEGGEVKELMGDAPAAAEAAQEADTTIREIAGSVGLPLGGDIRPPSHSSADAHTELTRDLTEFIEQEDEILKQLAAEKA